jgi:hypothetical protein
MIQRIETPRNERVESGLVVFDHCGPGGNGYDHAGVYLRGDLCFAMHAALKRIADHYQATATCGAIEKVRNASYIEQLIKYIEQANPNAK